MKKLIFEKYDIEIYGDPIFLQDLSDSLKQYDNFYFDQNEFRPTSIHVIKIYQNSNLLKSVAIAATGGNTGIHENSALIDINQLLICCSNSIFCLSIPDLTLLWCTPTDQATCFGIYNLQDTYIIHGEFEISRLDKTGNILWQQSGADIFITPEGKYDFTITENYILVSDWDHRKYKFDFNGQIIQH